MTQILVVEDDRIVAESIRRSLQNLGYAVPAIVDNGKEAIKKAEEYKPDLVLMDIVLWGEMDGIEAAMQIHSRFNIPAIYLSAYSDEKKLERAKITEPFGYIIKPFDTKELHTTIEMALYKQEMEKKVKESERWLFMTLKSIGDAVIATDAKGCVMFMNPVAESLTGWKQEEAAGKPLKEVFNIINEDTGKQVEDPAKKTIREGTTVCFTNHVLLIAKGGKKTPIKTPVADSCAPIRDEAGTILGCVIVFCDISERKKAEDKIRKLNQELELKVEERTKKLKKERDYTRHLIESSPDFQLTLDKEGKIMDVNEAFEHLVGKGREDMIGKSYIHEYIPQDEMNRLISEIFDKGWVRDVELMVNILGKGTLTWRLSGTIYTTVKGEEGVYLTGRDLTELRAKESQIIQAGRLSSLGEMATGVAHEINQPLSVISMAAESTLRDIEKNRLDISMFPRDLEEILKNVKRIDRIITHMRTFARQPKEWKSVEPEELLNNVFILLDAQFRGHNISVSRKVKENLPAINVDPNQVEQVFINIVTNARQVLDERGEKAEREGEEFEKKLVCMISRERIEEGEYVVFEFADNAYGVPEDQKRRIFEPFFTTKEAGEGTGLGLSIAYNIMTQSLGGKIWVEDNDMGGASFKVALPVKDKTTETRRHGGK